MSLNFKMFAKQFLIIFSFLLYFVTRVKRVLQNSLKGISYNKADQTKSKQSLEEKVDVVGNCVESNKKITIPVKAFFTTIPIDVEFHKKITGLMTFNCSCFQYVTKDGILYGKAAFAVDELNIHFKSSVKVLNIGPTIVFDAVYTSLKIITEIKLIPALGKCLHIDNIWIDELNVKKCTISGTGLFDAIGNFVFSKIIDPISILRFFIEFQIKRLINLEFSEFYPCVQVLQYSTTKLKNNQHIKVPEKKIKDGNNSTKLRVNYLGLEREFRRKENFCSSISNVLLKELLAKIGLHSKYGSIFNKNIAMEYLNFAKNFKTGLDLGLIPPEEFGSCLYYEWLSNNSEPDCLFESSFCQNSSKIESESEKSDENDVDRESLDSEDSIKSGSDYQSENISCDIDSNICEENPVNEMAPNSDGKVCNIEISSEQDEKHFTNEIAPKPDEKPFANEMAPKPDEKPFANEMAPKPDEKHFTNEMVPKHEEKHFANEMAPKQEEKHLTSERSKSMGKDCIDEMALKPDEKDSAHVLSKSGGIKVNKSVKFLVDTSDINLSDSKCSELNTTRLDHSDNDSEICDETDSTAGSLSSDSTVQSEGIKCIEYICYLDCFVDSSDYESDLKCTKSNNQLHLRFSKNL